MKYDKMNKIVMPEIHRLEKREAISYNILRKLEKLVDIDYCELNECHLINAIGKEIDVLVK